MDYEVEIEIQAISAKPTANDDMRYSIKSFDSAGKPIYYACMSTGKYAVEGIDKLAQGDFVTLQVADSEDGKFHNIKKILDVAKGDSKTPTKGKEGSGGLRSAPGDDRNRSFAMAYAKDLVVGGKVEIKDLLPCADKILRWLSGEE